MGPFKILQLYSKYFFFSYESLKFGPHNTHTKNPQK